MLTHALTFTHRQHKTPTIHHAITWVSQTKTRIWITN